VGAHATNANANANDRMAPQGPPKPSGFVPPYVLENIAKSKEATEEQRKAAQQTLDLDQARLGAGASTGVDPKKKGELKKSGVPEGTTSGKAQM
jgi:hypothetical protein